MLFTKTFILLLVIATTQAEEKETIESRSAKYPNEDAAEAVKFPGKSSSSYIPKPHKVIHHPSTHGYSTRGYSTPSYEPSYLVETESPLKIPRLKPVSAPHPKIPQKLIQPEFPQRPYEKVDFNRPPPQQQTLLPQFPFPYLDQTENEYPFAQQKPIYPQPQQGPIIFPQQPYPQRPSHPFFPEEHLQGTNKPPLFPEFPHSSQKPIIQPQFPINPQRPSVFPQQKPHFIQPQYPLPPHKPTYPVPTQRPTYPTHTHKPDVIEPQFPIHPPQKPKYPQRPTYPQKPTVFEPQFPQGPIYPHPDGEYDLSHSIPGTAGKDYPTFAIVPHIDFQCEQNFPGFYADMPSGCQVWHYCQLDGRRDSFLCPNGTIFNQKYFVCDWWYNVDCESSAHYYPLNSNLYREPHHPHQDGSHYPRPHSSGAQEHQVQDQIEQVDYRKLE